MNPENGSKERLSVIYAVAGKKKEKVTEMVAGDIGCTVKLKSVKTNQTLNGGNKEWAFESIVFPPSKFRTAIKAKAEKDEEKLERYSTVQTQRTLLLRLSIQKSLSRLSSAGRESTILTSLSGTLPILINLR